MSTSFEHSAMKSSFSLSSLRSGAAPAPGCGDHLERPYHSLTKKRKEPCREAWRRSWGSAASGCSVGDDLWPLLQHHYEYIMDNQIIDTCKEANGELLSNNLSALQNGPRKLNPTSGINRQWSLSQLIAEFTELCQWLTQVQEEIYSSPENLSSRKLRMNRMTELASVEPRRAKFIEQATAILDRIPEAGAEVTWRVEHLNVKWEGLRLLLSPEEPHKNGDDVDVVDTAHELRCLRRWLHGMEGRLPPPSLAAARAASYHELLRKLREHQGVGSSAPCVSASICYCVHLDAAKRLMSMANSPHGIYTEKRPPVPGGSAVPPGQGSGRGYGGAGGAHNPRQRPGYRPQRLDLVTFWKSLGEAYVQQWTCSG